MLAKGKCERIGDEKYGRKEYFKKKNIFNVRQHFRTKYGLQNFAGNYSNDKRFSRTDWLCKCRESREDEAHLMSGQCKVYGDLTEKYSDFTDDSLIQFFSEVLARRDRLDKEQLNPVGGVFTNVGANSVIIDGISQSGLS